MSESENKVKLAMDKLKLSVKNIKLSKKHKILIVVAVLIVAVLTSGIIITSNDDTKIYTKIVTMIMPKSLVLSDNGNEIEFFVEENPDYVEGKNEPIAAWRYYYFDSVGNRIDLPTGHYQTVTAEFQLALEFTFAAAEKIVVINNALSVIFTLIILAAIALLIYLWYKSWCRREDKRRAALKAAEEKINKKNN